MLKLNNVNTYYGAIPMLRNVSLSVGPSELVCLLGPNGAGKSTTFNAICGLLPLQSGSVNIMGQDIKQAGTERLGSMGIGFVPEGRRLFPSLTVRENLWLAFKAARTSQDFEQRLDTMAELFPRVRERISQKAGTMSGGEQAMVALARALISDPQLVIMDEPSLGLSPKLIDEYFEIVSRIRSIGKAVLLIEQNAETALSISDRGYLLVRGSIVSSGPSSDLLNNDIVRQLYL